MPIFKNNYYQSIDHFSEFFRWWDYSNGDFLKFPLERLGVVVIDEFAQSQWDSPLLTPKREIINLIKSVIEKGTKVIYLDFSFIHNSEGKVSNFNSQADIQFLEELKKYSDQIHLIINLPLQSKLTNEHYRRVPTDSIFHVLKESDIKWVSPNYDVYHDAKIREFSSYDLVCLDNQVFKVSTPAAVISKLLKGLSIVNAESLINLNHPCSLKNSDSVPRKDIQFYVGDNYSEMKGIKINKLEWHTFLDEISNDEAWLKAPEVLLIGSEVDDNDMHPIYLDVEAPGIFIILHSILTEVEKPRMNIGLAYTLTWVFVLLFSSMYFYLGERNLKGYVPVILNLTFLSILLTSVFYLGVSDAIPLIGISMIAKKLADYIYPIRQKEYLI